MLDTNIKIDKKEREIYEPLPSNIYQVELLDITSKEVTKYKSTELETVLSFQFVLLTGKEGEKSLRGRSIWRNYVPTTLYIGKKGKNVLYQIIEALIRRTMSPEDEATMSAEKLNKLIGRQCRIVTKQTVVGENTYNNIESFSVVDEDVTPLTLEEKDISTVRRDANGDDLKNPLGLPQDELDKMEAMTPEGSPDHPQAETNEINLKSIPF